MNSSLTPSSSPTPPTTAPTTPYPASLLLALLSLLLLLLTLPPLYWHLSNANVPAASLILWLQILNLISLTNALLWPHDNTSLWYDGTGLCDVQVKVLAAAYVGVPASVAGVLRGLAAVLDVERGVNIGGNRGRGRKRRVVGDLAWCWGVPGLQMVSAWVVQTRRYYVLGIAGCVPAVSSSWVADVLMVAPPVVWVLVGCWFAALVLLRMHRYRRDFTTLLAHSNTNRSRFARLFAICMLWLAVSIPLQAYVIVRQAGTPHVSFNWALVHDPEAWRLIEMFPSGGKIYYTRYIWLGGSFMVFVLFGFGRDAGRLYAKGLRAVGLGRCVPVSRAGSTGRSASHAGTIGSVSSKARLLFSRKSSVAGRTAGLSATDSRSSGVTASSMSEPLSPKTMQHLETAQENAGLTTASGGKPLVQRVSSYLPPWLGGHGKTASLDVEKNAPAVSKPGGFRRFTSAFRSPTATSIAGGEPVSMNDILRTRDITISSTTAPASPEPAVPIQGGVVVKKEVRQESEVAVRGF